MMKAVAAVATAFVTVWTVLYYLGRTWGATRTERYRSVAGDEIVPEPSIVTDHGITIEAAPEEIWPWLIQMGWGRGGWYTYRWVDRLLFPANQPSTERILPEFQQLALGDRILDGPPDSGCFFTVERLEREALLVLSSDTHVPPPLLRAPDVAVRFSWAFSLVPESPRSTRFHFRSRVAARPALLLVAYHLVLVPADFVMARSMCVGLKRRVEPAAGSPMHQVTGPSAQGLGLGRQS
jgi:hypothetical protein